MRGELGRTGVIDIISQDSEMFHLVASLPPSDYAKKTLGLGNNSDVITSSVSQQHYITRSTIHLVTCTD